MTIFFALLIIIPVSVLQINAKVIQHEHAYRVMFNQEDLLMNITQTMKDGEILEYNITLTEDNSSLTLITEILNHTGRLWAVYVEMSSY